MRPLTIDPLRVGHFLRGGIKHVFFRRSTDPRRAFWPSLYCELFEPDRLPALAALKERFGYRATLPRPIALDTTWTGGHYRAGAAFSFGIVLTGRLCRPEVVHALIFAVEEMGRRKGIGPGGKFWLKRVETLGPGFVIREIYDGERGISTPEILLHRFEDVAQEPHGADHRLRLELTSPLQLRREGKSVTQLPFATLLQALLLRFEMLQRYFCDGGERLHPRETIEALVAAASEVRTRQSSLTWQAVRTRGERSLGGLTGSVVYEGDLTPFLPYLAFGGLTGVGKKTTFGLGRFTLHPQGGRRRQ